MNLIVVSLLQKPTKMNRNNFILPILFASIVLWSCKENIDSSVRYVYESYTIADYLARHEQYSEYYRLTGETPVSDISQTTVRQLLTARGHYTVFAPTNTAIQAYLEELKEQNVISEASWDGFPDSIKRDSICKLLVMSSIIDSGDDGEPVQTWDFPSAQNAEILRPNMYDRKLTVSHGEGVDEILVNGIQVDEDNRDIPALNGVIHSMRGVIVSNSNSLGDYISDVISEKKEGFYVACLLANAVGLKDTLTRTEDEAYRKCYIEQRIKTEHYDGVIPAHRYYGYTFFAETDSFWTATLGKPALDIQVEDVVDWLDRKGYYPLATRNKDYQSEGNMLNQFVTYHLLPVRLSADRLVLHRNEFGFDPNLRNLSAAMAEYYTTMGKRRLMKLFESAESGGVHINRFPILDNGRQGTYHELSCPPDKEGILIGTSMSEAKGNLSNAMIYPLDKLLVYDEATQNNLGQERIRYDLAAMFPEATNNGGRVGNIRIFGFPNDPEYHYLDDAWLTKDCNFFVNTGGTPDSRGFCTYFGDEMASRGITDLTLRLPPVPREGTYEIRYGVTAADTNRGIFQFYWGNDRFRLHAMGIPLDLRMGGQYYNTPNGQFPSNMGWEPDIDDEDYNSEVDKTLRNHGFMKGAKIHSTGSDNGRTLQSQIRRIIVREKMRPEETYYLRLKSCLDFENVYLVLDYFEYCPKEVYDNPETPEDVW